MDLPLGREKPYHESRMDLASSVGKHVHTLVHLAIFKPCQLAEWCAGDGPMHVSIFMAASTCAVIANHSARPSVNIPWYETFLVGKD